VHFATTEHDRLIVVAFCTAAYCYIKIVTVVTVFIVLSSWHRHCESSPGSLDQYAEQCQAIGLNHRSA